MYSEDFREILRSCTVCPRQCGVDRSRQRGYCRAGMVVRAAKAMLHTGEEPCLVGSGGAGAIFFTGCNLGCVYCQNYEISQDGLGWEVDQQRLAQIMLELQQKGASCLDLVTPTPYLAQIAEVLQSIKPRLKIPVVYNCGGYERTETLSWLSGLVDIYLPDLKYKDSALAASYSGCADYFEVACAALQEMFRQVGPVQFTADGRLKKGLLVRHMVLPGAYHDSLELMRWLAAAFPPGAIRVSLMSQYTPTERVAQTASLRRRVTTYEYEKVVEEALALGLQGYSQKRSSSTMALRPEFDGQGI